MNCFRQAAAKVSHLQTRNSAEQMRLSVVHCTALHWMKGERMQIDVH